MAKRPIFIPTIDSPEFVKTEEIEFKWVPGMAFSQKKKNVQSFHAAAKAQGIEPVLEISTKSQISLGEALSAFNLKVRIPALGQISVEAAFQGSKVFELGGPFKEYYNMTGREIRHDERLRNSGNLLRFNLAEDIWGLEPKTAFYDWLYLTALTQNESLGKQLLAFRGFTDIEFNPNKSINCQAYSAALFVALSKRDRLNEAIASKEAFLGIIANAQKTAQIIQGKLC